MKTNTRITGAILLTILLGGCATTEIVGEIPQPPSQLKAAHIMVCRKRVFVGDGSATIISVDGNSVLRSGPGVCFSAALAPGRHTISVLGRSWAGPEMGKKTFNISAESTFYFTVKNEEIEKVDRSDIDNLLHSNYKVVDVQK